MPAIAPRSGGRRGTARPTASALARTRHGSPVLCAPALYPRPRALLPWVPYPSWKRFAHRCPPSSLRPLDNLPLVSLSSFNAVDCLASVWSRSCNLLRKIDRRTSVLELRRVYRGGSLTRNSTYFFALLFESSAWEAIFIPRSSMVCTGLDCWKACRLD